MKFLTKPSPALRYRHRSIRLTPEGVLFLFLTLLVGITALNTGNNLLYFLVALMLTLIIISGILSEWCLKGIQVEHRLPPHIFAHDPVVCRWFIRNKKSFFPAFTIKAVSLYPDMMGPQGIGITRVFPGSTQFQSSTLTFGRRGVFRSVAYEISTAFPFGFFEKTLSLPSSSEVVVYPKLHRLWMVQGDSLFAGAGQEVRKKGQGPALYNVRDYQQGDDPRKIHWKISARQAKLFVKEHEIEDEHKIQIWLTNQLPLDPSPGLTVEFEEAVSLAASLVHAFARKGYEVGLSTLDREIPSRQGMTHCYRILQHLALLSTIPAEKAPKNAHHLMGGLLTRPHQVILVLPWEDPFWRAREVHFTRIITPSQWRQTQGPEAVL